MATASTNLLTLYICSDFHAYDGTGHIQTPPSWLDIQAAGNGAPSPIAKFLDFLQENPYQADIAIFCGDLGDKAHPAAATFAWQKVHEISAKLGAKITIATAGNHDLDSRYEYNYYDARGLIQSLEPGFPSPNQQEFDRYWSRHFYILRRLDTCRILVLNSSAFHGYKDEYEHGRISPATLEQLKKATDNDRGNYPINILVCHHPPHRQAEAGQGEADSMKGGDDLINYLESTAPNQWLIIHGHKHYPKLQYARGSGDSPTILSCGSMSAIPYPEYGRDAKNQVHFVEFDLDYVRATGLHGIVKTFEWTTGTLWRPATKEGGLPSICGFGNRNSSIENAHRIAPLVQGKMQWSELVNAYPEISYLPGNSLSIVLEYLDSQLGIGVDFERNNEPKQIYKK
jgi:calcineurin-like phosphoesterase family protein